MAAAMALAEKEISAGGESGGQALLQSTMFRFFQRSFRDPALEKLYQSYNVKQKRPGLEVFLYAAILYDMYMLLLPGQDALMRGLTIAFVGLNLGLLAWCCRGIQHSSIWAAVPHLAWHLANSQLLAHLFLKKNEVTGRDSLGWVLLLDYLLYVTLPLRLRYCVVLSVGTCASYLVAVVGLGKSDTHLLQQVGMSVFYYGLKVLPVRPQLWGEPSTGKEHIFNRKI